MASLRLIGSLVLALLLLAGPVAPDARAAGMAIPVDWTVDTVEPCELCPGQADAAAAGHCAFACTGLAAMLPASGALDGQPAARPVQGAPRAATGRLAGPEPRPPR